MVWTQVSIIDFMCEIIYMTWQFEMKIQFMTNFAIW
jgi:hypothetical protein